MSWDANNQFSDAQNLAQVVGSYLSDKSFPTLLVSKGTPQFGGPLVGDFGRGWAGTFEIIAQIVQDFTSGGAGTLQVELIQADDGPLTTNVNVINRTRVYALAELVAGTHLAIVGLTPGI